MKKLSAGLILSNGKMFLGCHSTGNWFYDLPKGEVGEEEDPRSTSLSLINFLLFYLKAKNCWNSSSFLYN
ncbi:hypothetical protein GCM10007216_32370 [Thalassobacillus devorans]|uniref:Uncharacterized protein n=1 Tax=Thalassobacillus devorans TaxID=279813 RepID=A0ABQ1PLB8_9BACI|nr:hypothetical protein [Thalassobacillus devorans]GGC99132.1 hypothetical protein GCM10007216_32370 [Thalassobacillus devorans]